MRNSQVSDIRALMEVCYPIQDGQEAGPSRDLDAVCRAIVSAGQPQQPRQRRRLPRRWVWAAASACAAVAVLAAVAAYGLRPRPAGPESPTMLRYDLAGYGNPAAEASLPPGASRLRQLAKVAASQQPQPHPAADPVGYVSAWVWNMSVAVSGGTSASALVPEVDQVWIAPDDKGVEVRKDGPSVDLSGAQTPARLRQAVRSGPSTATFVFDYSAPPPPPGPANVPANVAQTSVWSYGTPVQNMTGSPAQIEKKLIAGSEFFDRSEPAKFKTFDLMQSITDLQYQVVSPGLESKLWTMLAGRSDVDYLGMVRDRAGREGEAFCTTIDAGKPGAERMVLIISPKTGMLLGEEDIFLTNPGGLTIRHFPTVVGYTTYVTSTWVSKLPSVRR